jgi:hypothetical protein
MKKLIPFFLLAMVFCSCKKEEDNNIIWEKSPGEGNAFFVESTTDSGVLGCGTLSGKPYLVKYNNGKSIEAEYTSGRPGLFSSALSINAGYIAAGSSGGKMLLAHIDNDGVNVWDKTISASFWLDLANLIDEGEGILLAIGSASPDSSENGDTRILFVRFNREGQVIEKDSAETGFVAVNNVCADGMGNIYLAVTRRTRSQKPKAIIMKFNSDLQKLWETELYNNPDFTAACYDAAFDASGNILVTGRTEASSLTATLNNSFLASVSISGRVNWKRYIENSNSGSSVIMNGSDEVFMLNRNCFIISRAGFGDGAQTGIIRMFSQCDSYTTDAFGYDMNLDHEGNILVAGSNGGNFYLALKSSQ